MNTRREMKNHLYIPANHLPSRRIENASRYPDVFQPFAVDGSRWFQTISRPNLMPSIKKVTDEMGANKTIRTGNEALHRISFSVINFRPDSLIHANTSDYSTTSAIALHDS